MLVLVDQNVANNVVGLATDTGVELVNFAALHCEIDHNIIAVAGFFNGVGEFFLAEGGLDDIATAGFLDKFLYLLRDFWHFVVSHMAAEKVHKLILRHRERAPYRSQTTGTGVLSIPPA